VFSSKKRESSNILTICNYVQSSEPNTALKNSSLSNFSCHRRCLLTLSSLFREGRRINRRASAGPSSFKRIAVPFLISSFFIHIFYHCIPSVRQNIVGLSHQILILCFLHFFISLSSQVINFAPHSSAKATWAASATPNPQFIRLSALCRALNKSTFALFPNSSRRIMSLVFSISSVTASISFIYEPDLRQD